MKQVKKYAYSSKEAIKYFDIEIKISADFKLYFMGSQIPDELKKDFSGVILRQNKFDSFSELDSKILEIISEYETRFVEETKKKVILYKIDYDERGSKKEIFFNYLVAQKIEIKTKNGTDINYYEERNYRPGYAESFNQKMLDHVNMHSEFDDSKYMEMIWTAERELWFENMSIMVRDLGNKLHQGFGKHAEVLARKIDQGMNNMFLLGSK